MQKTTSSNTRDPRDIASYIAPTSVSFLKDKTYIERVYSRSEKIAAAIFLLTKKISEKDTIKSVSRNAAAEMLEMSLRLGDGLRNKETGTAEDFLAHLRKVVSHIRLLVVAGYVSHQNGDIVIEAVEELARHVNNVDIHALSEEVILARSDVKVPDIRPVQSISAGSSASKSVQGASVPREQHKSHTTSSVTVEKHSNRQHTIVELIRKGGALGIRDIAAHIPGCGEKTVQRELAALVSAGTLKKQGEKRWSTYSIAR
jgi:hypothetical protein